MTGLLTVDRARKEFTAKGHTLVAVHDAVLRVDRGECVALVGESGSGKSTLAKLIVGLSRPTSGRIEFQGEDVARLVTNRQGRRRLARDVQMVFQDPYSSLDPTMTIEAIVAEPLRVLGWKAASVARRVREVLDLVELGGGYERRRPRELSGGQRQRVGIARALGPRPGLLILDEPVASLDVSIQGQILQLLQTIRRETEMGILVIAHDLGVVRAVSDRTAVMYLGRIVEEAPTADIFAHSLHPYTASLLASATSAGRSTMTADVRAGLSREALAVELREHGCVFRNRCARSEPECERSVRHVVRSPGHDAYCNVPLGVTP